jgi:hypothetical protein
VNARKKEIIEGTFHPFSGPVKDQSGTVRIPQGKSATDEEMLNMKYFVEGVIGTLE